MYTTWMHFPYLDCQAKEMFQRWSLALTVLLLPIRIWWAPPDPSNILSSFVWWKYVKVHANATLNVMMPLPFSTPLVLSRSLLPLFSLKRSVCKRTNSAIESSGTYVSAGPIIHQQHEYTSCWNQNLPLLCRMPLLYWKIHRMK